MTRPRIPARETIYNGIKMRSRLEATFAGILDGMGTTWSYEGRAYASSGGQYLPDFVVNAWTGTWFIEVKPFLNVEDDDGGVTADEQFAKMAVVLESYDQELWDFGVPPVLAIASPFLGDFMVVEYRHTPASARERCLGAFLPAAGNDGPELVGLPVALCDAWNDVATSYAELGMLPHRLDWVYR